MLDTTAKRVLMGGVVALFSAALPLSRAAATTTTATFTVTADVTTTCFVEADNLHFGVYSGVLTSSTTTLQATCSTGTPYTLGLDQGTSAGATVTTRKMTGPGASTLNYGLFQDAGHTINWGNTPGTDTVASTGTGIAQSFTVFGQLPPSQFVQGGHYADTITVTLTF